MGWKKSIMDFQRCIPHNIDNLTVSMWNFINPQIYFNTSGYSVKSTKIQPQTSEKNKIKAINSPLLLDFSKNWLDYTQFCISELSIIFYQSVCVLCQYFYISNVDFCVNIEIGVSFQNFNARTYCICAWEDNFRPDEGWTRSFHSERMVHVKALKPQGLVIHQERQSVMWLMIDWSHNKWTFRPRPVAKEKTS